MTTPTEPPSGAAAQQDTAPQEPVGEPLTRVKTRDDAAVAIQKTYRGYRERRQLQGMRLDAETRWLEAVKEARWRNATRPHSRADDPCPSTLDPEAEQRRKSELARKNWKRLSDIARRAGDDDTSDSSGPESLSPEEKQEYKRKKAEAKQQREKTAKVMDLQYFLEMVDTKHRYGSNLRAYHNEWKKADTNENFFYWLDKGEGKNIEVPTVSREQLEREQVRYLSREERQNYLVKINENGRLCWAKNGERINTTQDFRDSIDGVVRKDDETPEYRDANGHIHRHFHRRPTTASSITSSSSSSSSSSSQDEEGEHYINHDLEHAQGLQKIKHVSAATIFNLLLRRSVKPNSWIFVADTSFRLYVGIKQSGSFQHSSFLHGSRISAAGLIKIKDGQLRRLSPLSGHYRPPASNFRAFVHCLRDAGVDMSRVSISRSYAVLVGLEAYVRARKKLHHEMEHITEEKEKMLHPEEARRRAEEQEDQSESAKKERALLAREAKQEENHKKQLSLRQRIMERFSKKDEEKKGKRYKGQGAESAIAPEGKR